MAFVELKQLNKSFREQSVVRDVNLQVDKGEFITLLGPSGCGKTTVLRMIAGLEHKDSGGIFIDEREVSSLSPNQRNIGMVFQSYALFPNLTALENVMFGLLMRKIAKHAAREKALKLLDRVGLSGQENKLPHRMSGGQQQRVALARAVVVEPEVLLLDEPLSALDAKIRESLRDLIKDLQRDLQITTLFVTHDQEEALALSDRVAVINKGRVEQYDRPETIYRYPQTKFVAEFIGNCNFFPVEGLGDGRLAFNRFQLHTSHPCGRGSLTIGVRPEQLKIAENGREANLMSGHLRKISLLGNIVRLEISIAGHAINIDLLNNHTYDRLKVGDEVQFFALDKDLVPVK